MYAKFDQSMRLYFIDQICKVCKMKKNKIKTKFWSLQPIPRYE